MGVNEYLQSTEFKRRSSMAADSSLKLLFKGISIAIKSLVDFATLTVKSIFGK